MHYLPIAIYAAGGLGYIFSCVIAYHIYYNFWSRDAADSPLIAFWPIVLAIFVFIVGPVFFFIWICRSSGKLVKRTKVKARARKIKPEIIK